MSVLIKNATMPKCCDDCNLESYCNLWTRCRNEEERHPDCPLIEIKPHGRLIDADALPTYDKPIGKMMMFGGEYVYTQTAIDNAPTIIEAEEEE